MTLENGVGFYIFLKNVKNLKCICWILRKFLDNSFVLRSGKSVGFCWGFSHESKGDLFDLIWVLWFFWLGFFLEGLKFS